MLRILAFLIAAVLTAQTNPVAPLPSGRANLPVQRIGAHDLIAVSVYDTPELTRSIRVDETGQIRLPMLTGDSAEGRYPWELEDLIASALQREKILVSPVVTVTIVEYHSRPINVVGAVNRPLTFQAETSVSLLDAITRAGGLSPDAGPEVLVATGQQGPAGEHLSLVQRIPVAKLMSGNGTEFNIQLHGGEEIRVPEAGKVFVVGNVKKPGEFPIENAAGISVLELLALSEGLAPFATKDAYIYRKDEDSGAKNEIEIALRQIMDRKSPDVLLQENDILYVPDNRSKRAKVKTIEKILGFGSATASGMLVWGVAR